MKRVRNGIILVLVLAVIARIVYVNVVYPKTELCYVTGDTFMYDNINVTIKGAKALEVDGMMQVQVDCVFVSDEENAVVDLVRLGLINNGYYVCTDNVPSDRVRLETGKESECSVRFVMTKEFWEQKDMWDMVFRDFHKTVIVEDVFDGM